MLSAPVPRILLSRGRERFFKVSEGKRAAGITQGSNAPTEREQQEGPLECPIPNEEGVLPFIRADGTLEVSLCRITFMTPTEKAERQALAIKKRIEVRGEKCTPCQECHGGFCPKVDHNYSSK